jgi:hypothetical protein
MGDIFRAVEQDPELVRAIPSGVVVVQRRRVPFGGA